MEQMVDVRFPVRGNNIPVDHGFGLYGAISRIAPHLHNAQQAGLGLIRGKYSGNGLLELSKRSFIRMRISSTTIQHYLDLAGKSLSIDGHRISLGIPSILQLKPLSVLYAHIVTTKNGHDQERFKATVRDQMADLGVQGQLTVGKRKTFKVHEKQVVGYSLLVTGLTAEESIALQEQGLGGRRKMGCGIFVGIR